MTYTTEDHNEAMREICANMTEADWAAIDAQESIKAAKKNARKKHIAKMKAQYGEDWDLFDD